MHWLGKAKKTDGAYIKQADELMHFSRAIRPFDRVSF